MQSQAAPARFHGDYPHTLHIPLSNIPVDKFLRTAISDNIQAKTLTIDNHGIVSGAFPRLVLQVLDDEILRLAGGESLEKFDDIDCKDITCTCVEKPKYEQLFADTDASGDSIIYNTCKRTIFAAAKRQMKAAPVPSRAVAEQFLWFAKQQLLDLIGEDLDHFGYSYNQWYNHLTAPKQKRMDDVYEYLFGTDPLKEHYSGNPADVDKLCHYEAICKAEIQALDGKPRMVCAIPDLVKFIMGPVCWKLEELFQDKVPCYCGGKNLTQMEDHINELIDRGFAIVAEGDGSAFDNTQDVMLKELDRFVYERIADGVYHVPKDLFLHIALQFYKIMDVVAQMEDKSRKCIMRYAILGTVFSGDCDTTLMNTLRMGMYNWFTNYRAGLKFGRDFVAFSKGDDFTVMYHIKLGLFNVQEAYRKYWLAKAKPNAPNEADDRVYGLGQILKFIETGEPNSIKFCSLRAWYVDGITQHIYLTRDPAKFLALTKYSRKIQGMNERQASNYCLQQAQALRVSYPGLDYMEALASAYDKKALWYDRQAVSNGRCRTTRDKRKTVPLEAEEVWDGYYRQARHGDYKIMGNYWDTVRSIERAHTNSLTPAQLAYVNAQINAEFLVIDLKLLSGYQPV